MIIAVRGLVGMWAAVAHFSAYFPLLFTFKMISVILPSRVKPLNVLCICSQKWKEKLCLKTKSNNHPISVPARTVDVQSFKF